MKIKKEKTNQYINETELRSLIIRINNKSFLDYLSTAFLRLKKYSSKHNSTKNKKFKIVLEKYMLRTLDFIMKNEKNQLLLIPDDDMKRIQEFIDSKKLKEVQKELEQVINDANERNELLLNRSKKRTDLIRINKYIKAHIKSKSQKHKRILREQIVNISLRNIIDKNAYERFGEMVLLIVKNILKKPKFSGYTYRDEFYSDSTDKIIRYLKNFNHKLISKITGQQVNAFSYLSQYVHNSIVHIINTKNEEKEQIEMYVNTYNENLTLIFNESSYVPQEKELNTEFLEIKESLYADILNRTEEFEKYDSVKITYPKDYKISIDEYNKLKTLNEIIGTCSNRTKVSVIRKR